MKLDLQAIQKKREECSLLSTSTEDQALEIARSYYEDIPALIKEVELAWAENERLRAKNIKVGLILKQVREISRMKIPMAGLLRLEQAQAALKGES